MRRDPPLAERVGRRLRCAAVAALAALSAITAASPARADEHRLVWRDEWPKFQPSEYAYTSALWLSYLAVELWAPAIDEPRWQRPLPGDTITRNLLVASTRKGRESAGLWSDVLWIGTQVQVWLDSAAVPLFLDDLNVEVAAQITLMNAEAMGPTGLISRLMHRTIGRERPGKIGCRRDKHYERTCGLPDAASFPSGHTSASFVAAGLSCAHHQYLGLYGHPAADGAMCAAMLLASSGNGVLRLVADRHWLSDVIVGAAIGFGLGYGLPTLLHYGYEGPLTREAPGALTLVERAPARVPWRVSVPF